MAKETKCKHEKTHKEVISGTHHKYEAVVCDKCGAIVKYKTIK